MRPAWDEGQIAMPSVSQFLEEKGRLECWQKVRVKGSSDRSERRARFGGGEEVGKRYKAK